ncbi:DUF4184 family protein [Flavobacterium crassostreae]|uniref:DUF4184 domain-containing protein n=1 Tax=Flavobacterium crassostreae TaxID=1763534 RepID=A0A1B9E962_9FLAO|nr:DUF4184 family protein [Flavobacterium crassostreae]OCB78484.1 hypothetical protein LPBF_02170 [Flavobacterium crassostreae]
MPFTFSHPAIVLPFFKKKYCSATALVVGSMSPDLEYFFRMKMHSQWSHTFLGIFLIDFPLGFLVIFAFHEIIKKPLINHLPFCISGRLQLLKNKNWMTYFRRHVFIVISSFFLGAVSHIFWDSMTHWDGYLVQKIPFLNNSFFSFPVYTIAQHGSSMLGLILLFWHVYKLPVIPDPVENKLLVYWSSTLGIWAVILATRFWFGLEFDQLGSLIVSVLFSGFLAITAVGLLFREKNNNE